MEINKIDTIIFDLGGVIINVDEDLTIAALSSLSGKPFEEVKMHYQQAEVFKQYEKGLVADHEFRDGVRELLAISAPDEVIDSAWNAMLLDIPPARLDLIARIRHQFGLFVLSNTNDIHVRAFDRFFARAIDGNRLSDYFDKVYMSQKINARKPDMEAWQTIIDEQRLDTGRTLFIDDNARNIEAARLMGFYTFHNKQPDHWLALFE